MSVVAQEIIKMIDGSISETAGTDLFEADFTELPANQVCVSHYSGGAPDREMSSSLTAPPMERANVSVVVRNTSMSTARTKAQAIHILLDNKQNFSSTGPTFLLIQSLDGEPHYMGRDDNKRYVYAANYEVLKTRG